MPYAPTQTIARLTANTPASYAQLHHCSTTSTSAMGHSCKPQRLQEQAIMDAAHNLTDMQISGQAMAAIWSSCKIMDVVETLAIQSSSRAFMPAACSSVSTRGCTHDTCAHAPCSHIHDIIVCQIIQWNAHFKSHRFMYTSGQ